VRKTGEDRERERLRTRERERQKKGKTFWCDWLSRNSCWRQSKKLAIIEAFAPNFFDGQARLKSGANRIKRTLLKILHSLLQRFRRKSVAFD